MNDCLGYDCDGNEIYEYRILHAVWSNDIPIEELNGADPRFYCAIVGEDGKAYAISVYDWYNKDLIRFLMEFDIPLDLILTPSHLKKFFSKESKGNITGDLLGGSYSLLDISNTIKVFDNFLDKLLNKLYKHHDNIHIEKKPYTVCNIIVYM